MLNASQALNKLAVGNALYLKADTPVSNISPVLREATAQHGQTPYAVIVTCSDARVIPESIFSAAIGDLFVIRVAGNVIDDHQLGSIEYAAEHLGCRLILVLGHTGCGAVDAAIHHDPQGYIKFITDEIKAAIGTETDPYIAVRKNIEHSISVIEASLDIRQEEAHGLKVSGAVYHLDTGKVDFLN